MKSTSARNQYFFTFRWKTIRKIMALDARSFNDSILMHRRLSFPRPSSSNNSPVNFSKERATILNPCARTKIFSKRPAYRTRSFDLSHDRWRLLGRSSDWNYLETRMFCRFRFLVKKKKIEYLSLRINCIYPRHDPFETIVRSRSGSRQRNGDR